MVPNSVDTSVLLWLNHIAAQSTAAETAVMAIADSALLKGITVMVVFWWLWSRPGTQTPARREMLAGALLATIVAVAVGRALQLLLGDHPRPIQARIPGLNFIDTISPATLDGWSSMPSDHAVMYFALAAGVLYVSRPAGFFCLFHALVIVSLPRIAVGLHYPSDVLAGALVGLALGAVLTPAGAYLARKADMNARFVESPQIMSAVLFFLTVNVALMFDPVRDVASRALHLAGY